MEEVEPQSKQGGSKLPESLSRGNPNAAYRAVTFVQPECHVPVAVQGKTEYSTGPCQQAAAHDMSVPYTWYKTCTHGPQQQSDGTPLPPDLRPYYEVNLLIERTPVLQDGIVKEWRETPRYDVRLRLRQLTLPSLEEAGERMRAAMAKGSKFPEEFGITEQFCEYKDCWRTTTKKYRNGVFCGSYHAKLVKARETKVFLAAGGFDAAWPDAVSSQKRADQLAAIEV